MLPGTCPSCDGIGDLFFSQPSTQNSVIMFSNLTVVDCGNLTDPANGQVNHTSGTTFEQTATYSCNTGYNLVGDSTRTCQATGNWSGSAPVCQSMLLKGDLTLLKCAYTQET